MLDVTVIVGTFGHTRWKWLARRHAILSIPPDVPWVHVHGATLADARNRAAAQAVTEWICVLDADDQLEPGYLDADPRDADVLIPRVRYVTGGRVRLLPTPISHRVVGHSHPERCTAECLDDGNHIVVGAPIRRALFERAGGFREEPVYEDWALFRRLRAAGARFAYADGSVYRARINPRGRNHSLTPAERRRVFDEILAAT